MKLSDFNEISLNPNELAQAPMAVKAVVAGFILIAIVAVGYYMDWSPAMDSLKVAQTEEMRLRDTYTTKKRQAIHYQAYKQRLADTEKALSALLKQLPNKSEMDNLLSDVNQIGIGRGLEFDLFRPGNEQKADFYATLPVTIKVNGGYHDLGNFVSDIAKLPRVVTIHNIILTPNKSGRLVMEATVRTYRYLDPSEMPAKPKAAGKNQAKGKKT
ncbi:pilus assembly protein PilO [Parasulfuritortus cantonensis]|uniref:Pilus assembly protein PilO n=1 Tax=Parasulfuritortus cantonensis TaxID=2528202 RepID=A0A4R1BIV9_9PROT|nr:type 4a pilus biogenesis protein PilO [Parasulfuritortus cantonensis]TCJ17236.1 pilus assembly protein PilO [Parasulfuritortus cantonensis]